MKNSLEVYNTSYFSLQIFTCSDCSNFSQNTVASTDFSGKQVSSKMSPGKNQKILQQYQA